MLPTLLRDRRLWLVTALVILVFVLARFSLPAAAALPIVVKGGYWTVLLLFSFFAYAVSRVIRAACREHHFGRTDATVAAVIVVCGGILLAHEKYGFKVLADELLLQGTSMGMHYDRNASYPVRATDVQGPFQTLQNVLDKRPIFYPFVVSLAHDLTGYRPGNSFYVNTALGFVFLTLIYVIGYRAGRSLWAGCLLVLLFTGLPVFAQQMKGGGFELLNLVMLATVLLLSNRFAERRDTMTLEALCYAAVLAAYTRYESILLVLPVACVILWVWLKERRVILTWPVIVAPAFLLLPLLQNRVFTLNAGAWELASRPGATTPFGLQYVRENLGHAMAFFFDTTGYAPNSPFFAAVGLLAVAFFVVWSVRVLRSPATAHPAEVSTAVIGIGLLGVWTLLMFYFWGQIDDPVAHRLSLPAHLLMAVAIVTTGASVLRRPVGWKIGCAIAVAGLFAYSLPVMSRRAYATTYSPAAEMEWREEFLRRFPEKDYVFLDNDSVFWITHHVPSTSVTLARKDDEGLIFHLRNDTFTAVYVMQHFHINPTTGKWTMVPADDLGPDFELEPVWERRIQTLFIGRISRIKSIRRDGKVAATAGPLVSPSVPPPQSPAEWDAAKKAFVDHWLKQLP